MKLISTVLTATAVITISCNYKSNTNQTLNKVANNSKEQTTMANESVESQIALLKKSMTDYMESAHPTYTQKDIEKCVQILTKYNTEMIASNSKEAGMRLVKNTVLELNDLNDEVDGELIETGEREAIAEIIITAGHNKGYNSIDEDITEEWREW